MKITNHQFLPEPLVHALSHDRYDPGDGDISVTTLIAPAQIRRLCAEHKDELVEDAVDRIWSMLGSAVHYIIENATIDMQKQGVWDDSTHIAERRFYAEVPSPEGPKKLSAQIDLKEHDRLIDFKVTSVYAIKKAIYEGGKDEWDAQLNIQRYLMHRNGIEVKELFIMAIARDWNKSGMLNDSDYPPRGCMIEIPMWSIQKTENYIQERMNAHFSKHTPMCTPDEMWEMPPTYALRKSGRKSALRLGASEQWLMHYAHDKGLTEYEKVDATIDDPFAIEANMVLKAGHYIEERPGKRNRCEGYCAAAPFCDQYKEWLGTKE